MSHLSLPRIHFFGRIAASTATANNNNIDLVQDPDLVDLFEPYRSMSDAQFRGKMRELVLKNLPFNLGQQEILNANWDYYGNNRFATRGMEVTAVEGPGGSTPGSAGQDPLVGRPIEMLGSPWGDESTPMILVDNDPTCDLTTQVFCARVRLGDSQFGFVGEGNDSGPLPRAHSRWVNLQRNLVSQPDTRFSAVWQQAVPRANLRFFGTDRSPTLAALAEAAKQGLGLVIRYCTYYFVRRYSDPELAALFAQGRPVLNESVGFALGTVGAWDHGDLASMPAGRQLHPGPVPLTTRVELTRSVPFRLAPAVARVDEQRRVVTLDLINTFPEVNELEHPTMPNPAELRKVDLGEATLEVVNSQGRVQTVGAFPYDTDTYLKRAGIVEVPFGAVSLQDLLDGTLQIRCAKFPASPAMVEHPVVVETDDRGVYLTEGETGLIRLRVQDRGRPPRGPIQIGVQQFRVKQVLQAAQSGTGLPGVPLKYHLLVPQPGPGTVPPPAPPAPPLAAEPYLTVEPVGFSVGTEGVVTLRLSGLRPGVGKLRFVVGQQDAPTPDPLDLSTWLGLFWANVRVLPADLQYDAVPDDQVTWTFVYRHVLQFYHRLFPVMDGPMRLDDRQAVMQRAHMVKLMTSRERWHSTLYMPVTRDLSDGKRRLLHRWCNRVLSGQAT